MKTLKR